MSETNKRAPTNGFCSTTIQSRLDNYKKYSSKIPWRKWRKVNIVMCTLVQRWVHCVGDSTDETVEVTQLCPYGMKVFARKLLEHPKCKNFASLPRPVKEMLGDAGVLTAAQYKKEDLQLTVIISDPHPPKDYYQLYCQTCQTEARLLPDLLQKHADALGEKPNFLSLINNWDALKIGESYQDYAGCFLPDVKEYEAFPNARRFIWECSEHKKMHIIKVVGEKRPAQSSIAATSVPQKKSGMMTIEKPTDNPKQSTIRPKTYTKGYQTSLQQFATTVNLKGKVTNDHQKFAKRFCLSMVHAGAKSMLSNNATISNYEVALGSLRSYKSYSESKMGEVLPPAIGISLNGRNILHAQRSILNAHRYDNPSSELNILKRSPFWAVEHDGISKFGTEYNGILLRGVTDNLQPVHVPYALCKMKGGVDSHDTADNLIAVVSSYLDVKSNAFETIGDHLPLNSEGIPPLPPNYFKLGKIIHVDNDEMVIEIELAENQPIANTGDGVSVNVKAARILLQLYSFNSPDFRCSTHIAGGTVKRLATSKTMNVPEITIVYENVRTITKHFECSIKNKEALDEAMEILHLQPLHLISWCQTRMAHFLTACKLFDDSLVALYDVMSSNNIRTEERNLLFTPVNIYSIKLMASLNDLFMPSFLKAVDKTDLLVTQVYNICKKVAAEVEKLNTTQADEFSSSLKFDENGNLLASLSIGQNKHDILLCHHSKPARNQAREDQIERLHNKLEDVKSRVLSNVKENIEDQMSDASWYYNWSGLDLELQIGLNERVNRMIEVIRLYTTKRKHVVQTYKNKREIDTVDDSWNGYKVILHHPATLEGSEDDVTKQMRDAWPMINLLFMQEKNECRVKKSKINQLNIWKKFVANHFAEFPDFCALLQVMVATPANTSPLERSYTKLQIVTAKRRNHFTPENLEVMYLLAVLDIPRKDPKEYCNEVDRL